MKKKYTRGVTLSIAMIFLLCSSESFCQVYSMTTVAGTNNFFGGDGGQATSATLNYPTGVAVDAAGDVFIADYYNDAIREVNTSGIISTVAGNGTNGFSGDGGPATSAQLFEPSGIAVDAAGNLYIAEEGNCRVRKVNTSGIISTIAGNGTAAYSGDGGLGTSAELQYPTGVAVDAAGNVYIADYFNQRIREVNTSGIISTVAGNGTPGFSGDGGAATSAELFSPTGVAVDASGNIFIADQNNNRIREVNVSGVITTIAGDSVSGYTGDGGSATAAELNLPSSVTTDAAGNVYIVDEANNVIREVNTSGIISTIAGNGTPGYSGDGSAATLAELNNPWGVAINNSTGNIYIGDEVNNVVREVNSSGIISTFAGSGIQGYSGDGGIATSAELNSPYAVAVDASNKVDVADLFNNRIRQINANDTIFSIAGNGTGGFTGDGAAANLAELNQPTGVAVDASGNIYVADEENNRIRKINTSGVISTFAGDSVGGYSGDGGAATSAELLFPTGVAVDAIGNVFIADQGNNVIRKVDISGIITTVGGNGTSGYSGDGGIATAAMLASPVSVALDTTGNIYIADSQNNRIREIDTAGNISTIAGNGTAGFYGDGATAVLASLNRPTGVAVDKLGNIYIADEINNRIRKVNTSGIILTIAGNGTNGFNGDGSNATLHELGGPTGVAVDASGDVYVADNNNNRIRELIPAPTSVSENTIPSNDIIIYPNPSNGIFSIAQKNNFQKLNIEIYNVLGEKIISSTLNTGNTSFDLSSQAKGIYLYRIFSDDGKYSSAGKIVLQ